MRGMVVIAAIVGLLTITAGVIAVIAQGEANTATPTPAIGNVATATAQEPEQGTEIRSTPGAPTATEGTIDVPAATTNPDHTPTATLEPELLPPLPVVAKPSFEALTVGLARVEAYYSEEHIRGVFHIRWRPGAFPEQRADTMAAIAQTALQRANELLGTNDYEPIYIFLADQMFAEECWGCQGFAASDLRQVFILADGSVAEDEYASLLVHEIGHVLAGLHVALPHSLFFAEGLAVWISDRDIQDAGYVSPLQTAAWAHRVGILPTLNELRIGLYEGRVRARIEYDGAASFAFFVIETYGYEAYTELYALTPPDYVLGKDWDDLEGEWRAYLDRMADNTVNGVGAYDWWHVAGLVASGFSRVYDDPESVTAEQYAALAQSRIELNRSHLGTSLALVTASGLAPGLAN